MKKIIIGLKNNRQVYLFAVLGIILVIFPDQVGMAAPYLLGIGSLVYGLLNVVISLKYPDSSVSLGFGIINIAAGVIYLLQREHAISIIGVIWAMISLFEVAREIDEFRSTKKIRLINMISILTTIFLAALLMMDPFAHFYTHVRILGLEMISAVLVRTRTESRKEAP